MTLNYRKAQVSDLEGCTEVRGATRDNPIDRATLVAIGVTQEHWTPKLENGTYIGFVAEDNNNIVAFCFADTQTGEVLVLAVLPPYEGAGVGRTLLAMAVEQLAGEGFSELWLAASPNPGIRAHGFYRRLGWQPSQTYDDNGDEILRLKL